MSSIEISIPQPRYLNGYCSQNNTPQLDSVKTMQDIIQVTDTILAKTCLCPHDILQLNRMYETVDQVEKSEKSAALEKSGLKIIEKVQKKVQSILDPPAEDSAHSTSEKSAQDFINLYHLSHFSTLAPYGGSIMRKMKEKEEIKNIPADLIGRHLPYCISKDQYMRDFKTLTGIDLGNPETIEQVNAGHAIKRLSFYEDIREKRRIFLESHGEDAYPPYLDTLLENGYLHLTNHLLDMKTLNSRNERQEEIKTLTFSEVSHIILETKEVILNKVKSAIPSKDSDILFLIGGTRCGKSTTLCFLRGDSMVLTDEETYVSTSDHNHLIGHKEAISCTFLPTVETFKDRFIVDFPGFSDTSGSLVSLGIECALKALIGEYSPKVLVLEAITNTDEGYKAPAELGERLERLLENKKDCTLGITKYSQNTAFGKIKAIEKEQRKKLNEPSEEEVGFRASIETLRSLNMPALQPQIEELQNKLNDLEKKRTTQSTASLPDTNDKTTHKKTLKTKENELLKQIGLERHIPLCDLEDPNQLGSVWEKLSQTSPLVGNPPLKALSVEDEDLLKKRFQENLKPLIESIEFKEVDFEAFEKKVLNESLIKVLLESSHPEIGEFLHLSELSPLIVREFDKEIVEGCIRSIIKKFVLTIDFERIEKIFETNFGTSVNDKISDVKTRYETIKKYILGLDGKLTETPEQIDEGWKELRSEKQRSMSQKELRDIEKEMTKIQKEFNLTTFWNVLYHIPFGIPIWLHNTRKNEKREATLQGVCKDYCDYLDHVFSQIIRVKAIEKIIQKQEEINNIVESFSPQLDSFESLDRSLQEKSGDVSKLYGAEDWEQRVNFLRGKLENINKDLIPLLYLGCDPSFEVIKIHGDIKHCRTLLLATEIAEKNALLFEKEESGLIIILKKYEAHEKQLSIASEAFQAEHQEFFKSNNHWIETINMQYKVSAFRLEQPKFQPMRYHLEEITNLMGMGINTPLSQTLLNAAARPKVLLGKDSFLEKGLIEKPIKLFHSGIEGLKYHLMKINYLSKILTTIDRDLIEKSELIPKRFSSIRKDINQIHEHFLRVYLLLLKPSNEKERGDEIKKINSFLLRNRYLKQSNSTSIDINKQKFEEVVEHFNLDDRTNAIVALKFMIFSTLSALHRAERPTDNLIMNLVDFTKIEDISPPIKYDSYFILSRLCLDRADYIRSLQWLKKIPRESDLYVLAQEVIHKIEERFHT